MPADRNTIEKLKNMAKRMRIDAIELAFKAGKNGAHLGGGLSAIEILAVLYGYTMNYSKEMRHNPNRDRFLLSKGHGTLAYYTALHEAGLISKQKLYNL
jgi:transketolase